MGRRKNGQGLIRQRKDGRWEGRCVVGYDEKNLPITKNVLAKTKREDEEKLKALKETVQKPVVKTAADMPFGEYIDYWYRNFCELSIAATTRLKYENDIYKHIIPGIGKIPLAALKKSDLEKFYAEQMKSGNLDRNGVGDKKLSGAVMLERAECNHIPFHGLRHIFSTMALENGLDIKTLSAVLGHSSAETTISVYSHVTGEMERNAAKKMDDAFGTPKPADSPVCDDNPDDGQTPEQEPKPAEFTAKKSKKRKPGTGCISKVSKNTWQGKYTPRGKDGKREQHIVYAKSEEECERKLGEMIEKLKSNEITIA